MERAREGVETPQKSFQNEEMNLPLKTNKEKRNWMEKKEQRCLLRYPSEREAQGVEAVLWKV